MKNKIFFLILLSGTLFIQPACNKYLDIKPQDKFLDNQVYSSLSTIQDALNGVYINMAKAGLYGENLSCTVVDALAQYYNCSSTSHIYYNLSRYAYGQSDVQTMFSNTWSAAYAAILNLNLFMQKIPAVPVNILDTMARNLMLGEAHGLRAYLAFDMLRLYGPVYSLDSTSPSIPYPEDASSNTSPLLPANEVIKKALDDLQQARQLLVNDPVISQGVVNAGTDLNTFYKERNRRMNYFAVMGLTARVQLYAGNKTAALGLATTLIRQASPWFPWTDPTTFSNAAGGNIDRAFSSEVIFGLEDANLYNTYTAWFAPTNSLTSDLLLPLNDNQNGVNRLLDIYEGQENDYRYAWWWGVNPGSTAIRTFFKYTDPGANEPQRLLLPLMRMSEMYLIAAECETNTDSATFYMNQLQFYRGLHQLPAGYDLNTELSKAYQKEFWGEGQTFFYYKRVNAPSITSGSYAFDDLPMSAAQYMAPLPLNETQFR